MTDNEFDIKRAMVVFAHPDDADWGCSPTVALWSQQGIEVSYVVCTDGSKGSDDPDMTSPQLIKIRKKEQLAAGEVLGLKEVVFLDYEDAMLEPTLSLRKDITKQIRRFRPDVVITSSPERSLFNSSYVNHPDHIAASEATVSSVFPAARDRLTFPDLLEEGLTPHKVKYLFIIDHRAQHQQNDMGGSGNTEIKSIDVTDSISTAVEALKQHKSQVDPERAEVYMRKRRERKQGDKISYMDTFRVFRFN